MNLQSSSIRCASASVPSAKLASTAPANREYLFPALKGGPSISAGACVNAMTFLASVSASKRSDGRQ